MAVGFCLGIKNQRDKQREKNACMQTFFYVITVIYSMWSWFSQGIPFCVARVEKNEKEVIVESPLFYKPEEPYIPVRLIV